jgi:phosphoglucomutase
VRLPLHQRYQTWLAHPSMSSEDRLILERYSPSEIDDAFFKDIEFGTAGMRGIMGPGPNRINTYTIQKAIIAYGLMLIDQYPNQLQRGVIIAHDNRHGAIAFTELVSNILNSMGIDTFTFKELVPTPLLSYAVRHLHSLGGIMLTASHNPKEYNGVKVYDEEGCQLVPQKIQPMLNHLAILPDALSLSVPSSAMKGKHHIVKDDVEQTYLDKVKSLQRLPALDKKDFRIIFSPQHGASYRILPQLFKELGYQLSVVTSQSNPDPDFSGTLSPNPEEKLAYQEAIKLAAIQQAQLIMVADPDADRVGLAYLDDKGSYVLLNGNESAALLIHYLLTQRKINHDLPMNGVVYDTIVSSPLARKIAHSFAIKTETFLTGFKFIGDRIAFYEKHAGPQFIFGYEESYGCLIGDFVRDKDAIQALLLYAEMALYYFHQEKNLGQALTAIFNTYGYHLDRQFSLTLSGIEGAHFLDQLMKQLRLTPFKPLSGHKVVLVEDFQTQIKKDMDGYQSKIFLPISNVIKFSFEDGSTVVVRPSGTEPKCKFYFSITDQSMAHCEAKLASYINAFSEIYLSKDKRLK